MTEEQARCAAARLNLHGPGAEQAVWAPRRAKAGEWEVVKVRVRASKSRRLTVTVGARPHKPDPGELAPPPQPLRWWGEG